MMREFSIVRNADGWSETILTSDYRFDVIRAENGMTESIVATPL